MAFLHDDKINNFTAWIVIAWKLKVVFREWLPEDSSQTVNEWNLKAIVEEKLQTRNIATEGKSFFNERSFEESWSEIKNVTVGVSNWITVYQDLTLLIKMKENYNEDAVNVENFISDSVWHCFL